MSNCDNCIWEAFMLCGRVLVDLVSDVMVVPARLWPHDCGDRFFLCVENQPVEMPCGQAKKRKPHATVAPSHGCHAGQSRPSTKRVPRRHHRPRRQHDQHVGEPFRLHFYPLPGGSRGRRFCAPHCRQIAPAPQKGVRCDWWRHHPQSEFCVALAPCVFSSARRGVGGNRGKRGQLQSLFPGFN